MIRGFAVTSLALVFGATAAVGQKPPTHARPDSARQAHGAAHVSPGPRHDAMHARLAGSWQGTLNTQHGSPSPLMLRVESHQAQNLTVHAQSSHALQFGRASDVKLDGDRLSWTQSVGPQHCQVLAQFTPGPAGAPHALQGTMRCGGEPMSFTVRKGAH